MKQYKYRGWFNLAVAVVCALVAIIGLLLSQKSGFLCFFTVSIPQFILFAGQRKLTEQQWRVQENDRDERYHLVFLKSGAITAAVLESLTGVADGQIRREGI